MLRDTLRSADYFEEYIGVQYKRIERFQGKLQELIENEQVDEKIRFCHLCLVDLFNGLIYAEYSRGCSKMELKEIFKQYLSHIRELKQLTYSEALHVLSLAVLFDEPISDILHRVEFPSDALIDFLISFCKGKTLDYSTQNNLLFPGTNELFMQCLRGSSSAEDLKRYVENDWYKNHSDEAWFDAHTRNDDTYCGYWCFVGAAIAKIKMFDPYMFEHIPYFPVDLMA